MAMCACFTYSHLAAPGSSQIIQPNPGLGSQLLEGGQVATTLGVVCRAGQLWR